MRALLVFSLIGCSSSPPVISSDISSKDTRVTVTATANESTSTLHATLVGPHGGMILVDGDRLVARFASLELPMNTRGGGAFDLDLGTVTGTIDVVLLRLRDAELKTTLLLPPAFTLHAPATASRIAPLTITWDAATGPWSVTLDVTGDCIPGASRTLSFESGIYTFNAGELFAAGAGASCTGTVTMVRTTPPDARYEATTQTRTTTFESTP